jgi:UPF0755 protein
LKRAAIVSIVLVVMAAAAVGGWIASGLWLAADPNGAPRDFVVEPGEPLVRVAARLEQERLLAARPFTARALVLFAQARGLDRAIKSGEYELSPAMSAIAMLEKLVSGTVKTYAVTLPEGLRLEEIAERLEAAGIVEAQAFLAEARSPELARELGIEADTLEGYLYPETYRFPRDTPPQDVVRGMSAQFESRWDATDDELASSGLSRHQVVTLGSIVEKETGAAHERPLIAAVFRNRLKRHMRLQSDPTVIYGILETRGHFDGNIRRRDLEEDTPYNTYTRSGLPPGPIASVGMESIRAVLEPADVPYLYFVSRNDGTHHFSSTLAEHSRAVDRYQRGHRRREDAS